jgi:hypothetical protein
VFSGQSGIKSGTGKKVGLGLGRVNPERLYADVAESGPLGFLFFWALPISNNNTPKFADKFQFYLKM